MTRKSLIAAILSAAGRCGIAFYTGFDHRIDSELRELPAIWLSSPEMTNSEGCREGIKTYSVTIYLIEKRTDHSAFGREQQWAKMENTASRICLMVGADECVKSISEVEYMPAEFSLTNRGEISLAIKFKVQMVFVSEKQS